MWIYDTRQLLWFRKTNVRLDIGQRGVMDAIGGKTCWQKQRLDVMDEGLRRENWTIHRFKYCTHNCPWQQTPPRVTTRQKHKLTGNPRSPHMGVHVLGPQTISLRAMVSEGSVSSERHAFRFFTRKMSLGFSSAPLMPCQHWCADIAFPKRPPLGFIRQSEAFLGRALIW